jgi:hypothetical protein
VEEEEEEEEEEEPTPEMEKPNKTPLIKNPPNHLSVIFVHFNVQVKTRKHGLRLKAENLEHAVSAQELVIHNCFTACNKSGVRSNHFGLPHREEPRKKCHKHNRIRVDLLN